MFYLDNSETSWLVYADWLEDQDIDATHVRQEVIEPTSNGWCYQHMFSFSDSFGSGVGCAFDYGVVGGGAGGMVGIGGIGGGVGWSWLPFGVWIF